MIPPRSACGSPIAEQQQQTYPLLLSYLLNAVSASERVRRASGSSGREGYGQCYYSPIKRDKRSEETHHYTEVVVDPLADFNQFVSDVDVVADRRSQGAELGVELIAEGAVWRGEGHDVVRSADVAEGVTLLGGGPAGEEFASAEYLQPGLPVALRHLKGDEELWESVCFSAEPTPVAYIDSLLRYVLLSYDQEDDLLVPHDVRKVGDTWDALGRREIDACNHGERSG